MPVLVHCTLSSSRHPSILLQKAVKTHLIQVTWPKMASLVETHVVTMLHQSRNERSKHSAPSPRNIRLDIDAADEEVPGACVLDPAVKVDPFIFGLCITSMLPS
mmetsp:Transcript_37340/g.74042  ORF Transcript_37340/g.74042 Transcript_37340/m.74042 type:complete len:104 (+) Transcript_37340:142-453(+)